MNPCSPFSLKSEMTPKDYLILESLPHIIISGQCEKFSSRIFEK